MPAAVDDVFRALADPTRRAIFERLARDGEQTVRALTGHSGVSQPAVSKHLGVLKHAKLVRNRRAGRETHYSAQPQALTPLVDWMAVYDAFWRDRFDRLEDLLEKDGQMTDIAATRTLVIEREMPHPPEKIWRALTQGPLIEQWLMKNDFQPKVGHQFTFRATPSPNWSGVIDCEVLVVEPNSRLSYSWGALGLKSVVDFTLTPTKDGTHICMEQSGFRLEESAAYKGASYGWQKFIGNLEHLVGGLD